MTAQVLNLEVGKFQIIEKIKMGDLSADLVRKRRMDRELFWMSAMRTVFPLGLNDKIDGFGMRGNATDDRGCGYNMYRIVNVCDISGSGGRKNRHRKKRRGGIDGQALSSFRVELLPSFR